jgi:hypothetical protein
VQGQLRQESLNCRLETACAHCGRPLHIDVDSDLRFAVTEQDATPLVFVPSVDFAKLKDPSIIDAF